MGGSVMLAMRMLRCEGHYAGDASCSRCAKALRGTLRAHACSRCAGLRCEGDCLHGMLMLPSIFHCGSVHARDALWGRVRKGSIERPDTCPV